MNKQKKLSILLFLVLTVFVIGIMLPSVSASPVTFFDKRLHPYSVTIGAAHPTGSANASAVAGIFTATASGYVTNGIIALTRNAGSYGSFHIELWTNNASDLPGYWLTETPVYEVSSIPESPTWEDNFAFTFDSYPYLGSGTFYQLIVIADGYPGTGFAVARNATSGGYMRTYTSSSWSGTTTDILSFTLSGDSTPQSTPTPTPSPTPTPYIGNYWDNQASEQGNTGYAWLNSTIPFFVPLILVLVCAFSGYKFAGPWGFMAGLNLGIIFTYVIFPSYMPLWAVVTMLVVDGLLLFGKVTLARRSE